MLADLTMAELALVAVTAFCAQIIGGMAGYGTGLLMPLVLVPMVGAPAVVPIIALSAIITNATRVAAFRESLDLRMGLWADMLYFVPEAIPLLPRGLIAYDWYYYPFAKKPRVEFFNFAERDLAPALRQQGIAYYGCPMNGAFRCACWRKPLPPSV